MSFVKLMQEGMLKFLISQNCDGLHRKSGIPPENMAELHGYSMFIRKYSETQIWKFVRNVRRLTCEISELELHS